MPINSSRTASIRRAWVAGASALFLAATVACSPQGDDAAAKTVDDEGLAAAQAKFEELLKPPTDVWVPEEPLSESMKGKTFYFVYIAGLPSLESLLKHTTAANDSVGATTVPLTFTPGTDELVSRLQQALEARPDGVYIAGAPSSTITAQIAAFEDAGIPVVSEAARDKDDPNLGFAGYDWAYTMCENNAAAVIADSEGTANVLYANFPEVSGISNGCSDGFTSYMEENCPSCTYETKDFRLADQIANKNPAIVTGLMQARPRTKYIVWQGANSIVGVPQALKAAGITDVTQLSFAGDQKTWSDIRDGGQLGDLATDLRYIGYRAADAMYRTVAGDDVTESGKDELPTQFLTRDTAPDPTTTTEWTLPVEYVDAFEQSWGVS